MKYFSAIISAMLLGMATIEGTVKVLHISFHRGCIKDIQEVGQELGISITSWYILENHDSQMTFDGIDAGNDVYNITHERAERIWQLNKSYFEQFDGIITSDTAPLSRIFLQNGWQKPLIIWVCNRFDYAHYPQLGSPFPDQEYYELFAQARYKKNVRIIGYTLYEYFHLCTKGIKLSKCMIKPIGILPNKNKIIESSIPQEIVKNETLFIFPRANEEQLQYLMQECQEQDIKVYSGRYNGPDDLIDFKGVLFFPYAWSNLALFENMQRGVVHFVPSARFVFQLLALQKAIPFVTLNQKMMRLVEWYRPEYKRLFVYFDSWQDLRNKMQQLDYQEMKSRIIAFGTSHRTKMLEQWHMVFKSLDLIVPA